MLQPDMKSPLEMVMARLTFPSPTRPGACTLLSNYQSHGLGHAEGKEFAWPKKERTGIRSRNPSHATYDTPLQSTFTTGVKTT